MAGLFGLAAGAGAGIIQGIIGGVVELGDRWIDHKDNIEDNKHEAAMMDKEIQLVKSKSAMEVVQQTAKSEGEGYVAALKQETDLGKDTDRWVKNYRATLRPNLTYLIIAVCVGFSIAYYVTDQEFSKEVIMIYLLELLNFTWTYWFTNRSSEKMFNTVIDRVYTK